MSWRAGALALCLFLPACAAYTPYVVEIQDQGQLKADLGLCQGYAAAYRPGLSAMAIGSGAAVGAAQQAPAAVVSPLVLAIGALGGASTATINGLDLWGQNQQKIVVRCLIAKSDRSHAYLVIDPLQ